MPGRRRSAWPVTGLVTGLVAGLVLVGWVAPVAAHPYHTTLAEADWNGETNRLEIALRLLPEDFERALSARDRGSKPPADDPGALDDRIVAWLSQDFRVIPNDGEPAPIEWVGKEISIEYVWLYFEIPLPGGLDGVTFEHRLLLDLEPEQVNTLLLRHDGERTTLTFRREGFRRRLAPPNP